MPRRFVGVARPLTPEQQQMRAYSRDSPNWERWFVLEHVEERRRGVHVGRDVHPPPREVLPHKEDEDAAYQAALERVVQQVLEVSRIEGEVQWDGIEQALALSAARVSVHVPCSSRLRTTVAAHHRGQGGAGAMSTQKLSSPPSTGRRIPTSRPASSASGVSPASGPLRRDAGGGGSTP
ncbi:hypothetical protein D1007_40733 [Hordeum vulgare]|nr:hypothetical protein D1007_40733 [Hordeum vulgare]